MKRKRRHHFVEPSETQSMPQEQADSKDYDEKLNSHPKSVPKEPERPTKKLKSNYTRVQVDPSKKYTTPDSRESWGPNVKGKKFRKEKGKKKRCPNAGVRIDGSVKSIRLDA